MIASMCGCAHGHRTRCALAEEEDWGEGGPY